MILKKLTAYKGTLTWGKADVQGPLSLPTASIERTHQCKQMYILLRVMTPDDDCVLSTSDIISLGVCAYPNRTDPCTISPYLYLMTNKIMEEHCNPEHYWSSFITSMKFTRSSL